MIAPRQFMTRVFPSLVILFSMLGCVVFTLPKGPAPSTPVPPAGEPLQAVPSATFPPIIKQKTRITNPTFAPAATATISNSLSTDQIYIDYTYTDSLITVIYPLYGSVLNDYVVVDVTNNNAEAVRIVVTSQITGFTDQAVDTIDVDAGDEVEVRQNPRLISGQIDNLNVAKPASFHLQMTMLSNGDQKILLDETQDVQVYGRRDFPWAIEGFSQHEDFELLASMVTPNDPAVEGLIRSAANHISSGIMTDGYSGDIDDENGRVWDRLQAIWDAEDEDYNLTYISTLVTYAPGDIQRIRLPADVLDQQSGNCVELAILYASAAEALNLETALIRIPGHAYMAVRTDDVNANYYVIETTMIGRYSFSDAIARGSEEFNDALPHIQNGDQYYDWITISEARQDGILPLPWH